MASEAILKQKQGVIDEIKDRVQNATTVVLFDYRGITDSEAKELRIKLRETNSDYKVYKNTLMARAFNELGIDLNDSLNGPSAFAFGTDQIAPIDKYIYEELNHKVSDSEYDELVNYAYDIGVRNAFIQEGDTQKESFIPDFDLSNV